MEYSKNGNWQKEHKIVDKTDTINFEGKLISSQNEIMETFNKHFISVAENIITKNNHNDCSRNNIDNTTPFITYYNLSSVTFQILYLTHYQLAILRTQLNPSKQKGFQLQNTCLIEITFLLGKK
jgi:hypothetical protein